MKRLIYRVILVVTTLTLIGFGVPLALMVRKFDRDQVVERLEGEAARAALQVPEPFAETGFEIPQSDPSHRVGVYDTSALLRSGMGPGVGDHVVQAALTGVPGHETLDGHLVVAIPIISDQKVRAVVRVDSPTERLERRVRRTWLLMGALGAVTLAAAAAAATIEARRLSRPVDELSAALGRLGNGDFAVRTARSGVPELDAAATSLDATAQRLGDLVERERSFAARASHQLRTPLTGIRLQLENALRHPESDRHEQIADALDAVDRLEATIDDLLALTRQHTGTREVVDLASLITVQSSSWKILAASHHRPLEIHLEPELPKPEVSEAAVRQVLEVLVANAFGHGAGTVTVSATRRVGGVIIEVSDEGPGVSGSTTDVFRAAPTRPGAGPGDHHGLGLPLAHSLAESTGGRLLLRNVGPNPHFALLLAVDDDA